MIITILRKPLESSVADNTLKHGCGALNIDDTRVVYDENESIKFEARQRQQTASYKESGWSGHVAQVGSDIQMYKEKGRWPANFILTNNVKCVGSNFFKQFKEMEEMIEYFKTMITPPVEGACVIVTSPTDIDFSAYKKEVFEEGALIPITEPMVHGIILLGEPTEEQSKQIIDILKPGAHVVMIPENIGYKGVIALEDTGFEVRDAIFVADEPNSFCYTSKAGRSEREAGLDGFNKNNSELTSRKEGSAGTSGQQPRANIHPTVKPIGIMEWCARDIAPNSKVVDPFLGSGTTGIAMSRLHHDFVGIELNPEYAKICEARIRHWMPIGTEIESEAKVGKREPKEGELISIFDLFKR